MASRKQQHSHDDNLVLAPKKAAIKSPPLFKVVLLNDDYTPMDFVIVVLQKFFAMSAEQATIVMLQVHRQGKGVCGIYPRDVAATKVAKVTAFARQHLHPLACVMEES
jgi:ATP-dependent Clp protease adaptor protein ClpS